MRAAAAVVVGGLVAGSTLSPAFAYHHRRHHHHYHHAWRDNVGSIYRGGHGYGHNRFTGERYHKCMEDLGYGRAEPCDAGGRM
jgi:hypothetical protein